MQSEAGFFLEALFADKPDETYILLWTLPEKCSHWFQDVGRAIQFAECLSERDLYVGVGLSGRDYGPGQRCVSEEVTGIVGLWADLDLKSDAHSKVPLPRTIEDAIKILPKEFPPTFTVLTGNGVHVYWLFRETLVFESDKERGDAGSLALRWQSLLRLNASSHGWAFDRLADLARVLRVPGTQNCKDRAKPKPVEIHSQTAHRYNPGEIEEYLDERGIPNAEVQEQAAQAWKAKFADKPLVLDPSVIVPEHLLAQYMATDQRFEKTWLRQRDDLKDPSQSAYDMALANFGSAAGLTEQQTADLIIQHRRIHRQAQRTRLNYFHRTIAKAFKPSESVRPVMPLHTSTHERSDSAGFSDADSPCRQPDAGIARGLLCEQLSLLLGVRVVRILKITGKEPTYQVELEDAKIEFVSISKFVDQRNFSMAIASATNRLIPKVTAKLWEQIAQLMLDALTIQDGGEETDFVGSARMCLEHYLSETPFIDSIEGEPIQSRRKPTIIDGKIAICSSDFQAHINKAFNENLSVKAVASMLTAFGALGQRVRGARLRDQSRWLLPLSEFVPGDFIGAEKESFDADPS